MATEALVGPAKTFLKLKSRYIRPGPKAYSGGTRVQPVPK